MLKNFLMWGERGLVATFLLDLVELCDQNSIKNFLSQIEIADQKIINFSPESIECIVEPDFGNKGFGHPDGVIILKNKQKHKIVIFLEAKRTSYEQASKVSTSRGTDGYNSTINGQLELNYRLSTALTEFNEQNTCLEEPDWILQTPYSQEKRKTKRKLQNPHVLNNVVSNIAGLDIRSYYHLVITHEENNPFLRNVNLPEIYSSLNCSQNVWGDFKSNFGWINYDKINAFMQNIKQGRYLASFNFNKDNLQNCNISSVTASYGKKAHKLSILKKRLSQLPIDIKELLDKVAKCFANSSDSIVEHYPGSVTIMQDGRRIGKINPLSDGVFVGFRGYSPEKIFSRSEQTLYKIIVIGQTFIGVKIPIEPFDFPYPITDTFIEIMKHFIQDYTVEA